MNKQEWFEMKDMKRKKYNKSVWIPLRSIQTLENKGKSGYFGYKNEIFYTGSVAFPIERKNEAQKLKWMDIGLNDQRSYFEEKYIPSDIYKYWDSDLEGIHLILDQEVIREGFSKWYLHQDLVIALELEREGDTWVCPKDGYTEVVRIKRDKESKPILIEMKAEYLKDYLCARNMGLYMTSYAERNEVFEEIPFLPWKENKNCFSNDLESFESFISEIHEGGMPYGEKAKIIHMERTDVEIEDDIPDLSKIPTDNNVKTQTWEKGFDGKRLYSVYGRYWFNEWIEPGKKSPKIRRDKIESTVNFIIDTEGSKICGNELRNSGKWLWFKPDIITNLCNKRDGKLSFYTKNTGSISCSYGYGTYFGVNDLGYINIFAEDISLLPEWQQQIWCAYNIAPEGGLSKEAFLSQVKADPADTQAPESFLKDLLEKTNELSNEKLGINLFRNHQEIPEIITKIHRFRAVNKDGVYALAKDLARLIADDLNTEKIQKQITLKKGEKLGSIKSLERLLVKKIGLDRAKEITKALVGIYELRHGDAHLPSSEINEAFDLVNIDQESPYVFQGYKLIHECVVSLSRVHDVLNDWDKFKNIES